MAKKKGLDLTKVTALIFIIILLGIGITMIYYSFFKVVSMEIHPVNFKVSDWVAGFNADPNLTYGKIPMTGGRAEKEMVLHNPDDFPVLVDIRLKGETAPFMMVEDNLFLMQPGENKTLMTYIIIPDNYNRQGNFSGEMKILFLRP